MEPPRIFISMGTPYTKGYADFRDALENFLRNSCGADPRIIGKNEYPSGSPLTHIRDVMRTCHGVIIVAYERKFLESGIEKRGSESSRQLEQRAYTTPWNHIESAMAYCLGIPLYIICQHGLSEEGLIESKIDWYVQYTDLSPAGLTKAEVADSIRTWVHTRCLPRTKQSRISQALQGGLKLSEMTPKELAAAFGAAAGIFGIGAAAATLFPKLFQ